MNYPESQKILAEIKKAKRILVNCHRSPDPDSVGSALAMRRVLIDMGKTVEVVCPDNIPSDSKFMKSSEGIKKIDYDSFDFSSYDLFLILDSSEWVQVMGYGKEKIPTIKKIVIDHHYTNEGFGDLNIVDKNGSSTAEVLYRMFEDWGLVPSSEVSENLLTGLIYDTSSLEHSSATIDTAKVMVKLMELGADKDKIILNLYRSLNFDQVKLIGEFLKNIQVDIKSRFVWSALSYQTHSLYPESSGAKTMVANLFASSIENADYGIIMVEEKPNTLSVSLRAKAGFDISQIAEMIGGGGHKQAGGSLIKDLVFDQAVEKVLAACRKYARKD